MFKYRWRAEFEDRTVIEQPEDDKYSKHDESAGHNPSAFRDILDYQKISDLVVFSLFNDTIEHNLYLKQGFFIIDGNIISIEQPEETIIKRKLVYYRTVQMDYLTGKKEVVEYNFGYEARNDENRKRNKVITIV